MNFLDLVNRTKQEAGRSGGDLATLVGATNDDLLIVNWVATAWAKIQRLSVEWSWMRATVLTSVTASQITQDPAVDMLVQPANTTAIADFRNFYQESSDYRVTLLDPATPADEGELRFLDYPTFRRAFVVGTHDAAKPRYWSISSQNKMLLGPKPDIAYHVRFDYRTTPTDLALDADEPTMPSEYHMILVWEALMQLASFDNAAEVYSRARDEYLRLENDLYMDQTPSVTDRVAPLA